MTWFEISVRTCEHRYQAKEPNIFLNRFNNLIIICGMEVYQNKATLFREKPINNPQTASQNNGYNITIQYGILLYVVYISLCVLIGAHGYNILPYWMVILYPLF